MSSGGGGQTDQTNAGIFPQIPQNSQVFGPNVGGAIGASFPVGSIQTFPSAYPEPTKKERELAFLKTFVQAKEEIVWRKVYEAKWGGSPSPKKDLEKLDEMYRMVDTIEAEIRREQEKNK